MLAMRQLLPSRLQNATSGKPKRVRRSTFARLRTGQGRQWITLKYPPIRRWFPNRSWSLRTLRVFFASFAVEAFSFPASSSKSLTAKFAKKCREGRKVGALFWIAEIEKRQEL